MTDRDFIAPWYPFTIAEIRVAFLAMGEPAAEVDRTTAAFAEEISSNNYDENGGLFEFGDFLGPVAALSRDAARRVAEFRKTWGPPHPPGLV
jgi:hypothetical protein